MIPANKSVLIICPDEERYLFAGFLSTFDCTYKETLLKIYSSLKLKYYDGMIIYNVVKCTKDEEIALKYISDCFPHLNTVAILKKTEVKLSHFLGRNGIKEILFTDELEKLALLLNLSFAKITLEKLNISVENYSPLLQKILRFIESNYLCILTITDIANYIGINECTITREFQKNNLSSPKRLLMYFKVMHSFELLKNTGLKIKEIATLSGFTNEQRYLECFERIFRGTPTECRKLVGNYVQQF